MLTASSKIGTRVAVCISYDGNNYTMNASYNLGYYEVHTFPKYISLKANVIAQLKFEIAYCDLVVQHFSHYARSTPPTFFLV